MAPITQTSLTEIPPRLRWNLRLSFIATKPHNGSSPLGYGINAKKANPWQNRSKSPATHGLDSFPNTPLIMRFIENLSTESKRLLTRLYKQSRFYRVRLRAHCILLSANGYTITELLDIFQVDRTTIYNWFNAFGQRGFAGLYDKKGRGRKPTFTPHQQIRIKQWASQFPKQLKKIQAKISDEFHINVSQKTIKRTLKALGLTWRRIRRKPKGEPDPVEYQQKAEQLEELKHLDKLGMIDLRYFDESSFCLVPYVPYAWQQKDTTIEVQTTKSRRLNVLEFLSRHNQLSAYTIEGSVNSDVVIACIDDFSKALKTRTVLVIDNAAIHTSKAFQARIAGWQTRGLELFYLPPYSPELNLIEILWRFIKYEWIEFSAYTSFQDLVAYVEKVIQLFGEDYQINFV